MPAECKTDYGERKTVRIRGSNQEKDEDLNLPSFVCHEHRTTILFGCLCFKTAPPSVYSKEGKDGQMFNLYSSHGQIAGHLNRFESRAATGVSRGLCESAVWDSLVSCWHQQPYAWWASIHYTGPHLESVQQQPTQFLICCPGRSVPYSAVTSSSQRHPDGKGCFKQNSMGRPRGWRSWERAVNMTTKSNIICYSKLSSICSFSLKYFSQNFSSKERCIPFWLSEAIFYESAQFTGTES